jgi:hypothetical protein
VLVASVPAADALFGRPPLFRRLGPHLTATFTILLAVLASVASFYYAPDRTDPALIGSQPGVSLLAGRDADGLSERAQVYAVVPDCTQRSAIVVVHKSNQGYHRIDLGSGRMEPFGSIRDPSDDVLFRCRANEMVLADWRQGRALVVDGAPSASPAVLREFQDVALGPGPFIGTPDDELLWYLDAGGMVVRVADARSGRLLAESKRFAFGLAALAGDRAYSASDGELVEWHLEREVRDGRARSCDTCSGRLTVSSTTPLDPKDWNVLGRMLPNASIYYAAAANDRVFVASMQAARVQAFDASSHVELARVILPGGARHISYAPGRDLLLVSGWTTGVVSIVRGRDLTLLRTVTVGARPRMVGIARDESFALVGTGAGIVRLDLGALAGFGRARS